MKQAKSQWTQRLQEHCQSKGLGEVVYQDISDRRGGRTAWSSIAVIQGAQYQARFWYDGSRMDQAREDAAEIALHKITGYTNATTQPHYSNSVST